MSGETKERAALAWPSADPPDDADDGDVERGVGRSPDLQAARAALAGEWRVWVDGHEPQTAEQVATFYREAHGLAADLEAWHALPERQEWTRMLVHVAQQAAAEKRAATDKPFRVVDIGCGAGHDLLALQEALSSDDAEPVPYADVDTPTLWGVEPNDRLRQSLLARGIPCSAQVESAPIESADLLICIDVLEHIPYPGAFLVGIAARAPVGCLLFENTATYDTGTPLHLRPNWGWQPGRALERSGWEQVDRAQAAAGNVRVWRRTAREGRQRAGLLLCGYRSVSLESLRSVMAVAAGPRADWRLRVKNGDALIARSRGIVLTDWWRTTADDVALMVDDDIAFSPDDADHIVSLCREGYDVVCGAYPVRDGGHMALRCLEGAEEVRFGPDERPVALRYGSSGFMAIHRRVLDALIAGAATDGEPMPLCHARHSWSFYNLFPTMVAEDGDDGPVLLSEDWGFCEIARRAGFGIWLDPTVRLQHAATIPVSVRNMAAVHAAIARA